MNHEATFERCVPVSVADELQVYSVSSLGLGAWSQKGLQRFFKEFSGGAHCDGPGRWKLRRIRLTDELTSSDEPGSNLGNVLVGVAGNLHAYSQFSC